MAFTDVSLIWGKPQTTKCTAVMQHTANKVTEQTPSFIHLLALIPKCRAKTLLSLFIFIIPFLNNYHQIFPIRTSSTFNLWVLPTQSCILKSSMAKIAFIFHLKIRPIVLFFLFLHIFLCQCITACIPSGTSHPALTCTRPPAWWGLCHQLLSSSGKPGGQLGVSWTQQQAGDVSAPWEGCRLKGSRLRNQETCFNLGSTPHPNAYEV